MKCQFGSTPVVVCQDGMFTIKTLLHIRKKLNFPTWVAFADLVKAFDTFKHALLIAVLGKYGASPRLCSTTKCMYDNSVVQIIFGNIETSIDFKVGFKQGNIMAPVIFLLLMIDFHKTLEDEWDDLVLIKCQFTHRDNSQISTGQLVIHQPETFVYRTLFDIF